MFPPSFILQPLAPAWDQGEGLSRIIKEGEKATSNSNIRVRFEQSISIHSEYTYFLYELFKAYTLSPPKSTDRKSDKRTGKIYNSLVFKTRMLPCFN